MKIQLFTVIMLFLASPVVWAEEGQISEQENAILALTLTRSYEDGGYTVVEPETVDAGDICRGDAEEIKESKKYIIVSFQTNHIDVSDLLDQLLAQSKKSVRLSLKSSAKDGYIIDYDKKYSNYFKNGGDGWRNWHKGSPQAHGHTRVALPIYDSKTGLVLMYMGTQSDWLAGAGWLILYKYENGKLKEINRVMMWIS